MNAVVKNFEIKVTTQMIIEIIVRAGIAFPAVDAEVGTVLNDCPCIFNN
jgi:hypothetical protein